MIRKYIRQSWELIRSERLYTALYVAGVALSITTVMVLSIVLYVRLAPVYPEINRDRTMYVSTLTVGDSTSTSQSGLSLNAVNEFIAPLEGIECYTVVISDNISGIVKLPSGRGRIQVKALATDANFFKVYGFDFIAGTPFTYADFETGRPCAVVSDRMAIELYGNVDDAMGKEVDMDTNKFRIVGVVREASSAMSRSNAQVFVPYTFYKGYDSTRYTYLYGYQVVLVRKPGADESWISSQFDRAARAGASSLGEGVFIKTYGQPISHYDDSFRSWPGEDDGKTRFLSFYMLVALVLLFVPALNLCGMIVGRMDRRRQEMAIRKSFGAKRGLLLWQVLVENFLLTLIGAAIGLAVAWGILYLNYDWIFNFMDEYLSDNDLRTRASLDFSILISPAVFCIALCTALLLNIMSSLIPAWLSLRHPIVKSLNERR